MPLIRPLAGTVPPEGSVTAWTVLPAVSGAEVKIGRRDPFPDRPGSLGRSPLSRDALSSCQKEPPHEHLDPSLGER
jgi:hypothetical protein